MYIIYITNYLKKKKLILPYLKQGYFLFITTSI